MARDPPVDVLADGGGRRPRVEDLPELRPERWPDDAAVDEGDLPPIDPERQALRIQGWEETGEGRKPQFLTLPRETWAREAAHQDAARRVLERLHGEFDGGFKVWTVPPDPEDPDALGEVVVGYLVDDDPDLSFDDLRAAVPDEIDGVAAEGTDFETVVEGIPVVIERTKG